MFEEDSGWNSHGYRVVVVFEKPRFQIVFCPHENAKPACLKFLRVSLVFRKTLFLVDNFSGIKWTGPYTCSYITYIERKTKLTLEVGRLLLVARYNLGFSKYLFVCLLFDFCLVLFCFV